MLEDQILQEAVLALPGTHPHRDLSGGMLLSRFVATHFIPHHVMLKSPAGRTHFHAILKHILTPTLVDSLFAPHSREVNGRLRSVPGWPYLDEARLGAITPEHVRRLISTAAAHGYSHQTVKHIRNVIGTIFVHARRERVFDGQNPASEVKLEPPSSAPRPQLSEVQTNAILNLLDAPERDIAMITINTGLTIPEICALQWKHINLSRGKVSVDGMWIPPGFLILAKTWASSGVPDTYNRAIRGICISTPLARHLIEMKQKCAPREEDFLFGDSAGRPMPPSEVRTQRLRKITRYLDLPWVSWHSLRQASHGPSQGLTIRPVHGLKVASRRDGLSFKSSQAARVDTSL